ncbi:unnamed protein product [Calypogeia fissa]
METLSGRVSGNVYEANGTVFDGFDKVELAHGEQEVRDLQGQQPALSGLRATFHKVIRHGGSVYDAWLNAVSAQVGQVILSMPTSYIRADGYREERKGTNFANHVIQYHEVVGALVGPWARRIVLFFNIMTMGSVATVQIIACASNAYYLSDKLDKQQYALIFGGLSMCMVLLPSLHNFRVFSF